MTHQETALLRALGRSAVMDIGNMAEDELVAMRDLMRQRPRMVGADGASVRLTEAGWVAYKRLKS